MRAGKRAREAAVSFAAAPGKKSAPDGAYAGLAVLQLETSRFVLQLSGAPKAAIRLTVTQAPPRT
ncbi:MAG TPA: hypothetical protein VN325_30325 [Steroidobacteraceae bacterium]|nr:hypothetical protein [Steroidobacteraceae bacterium]